MPLTLWRCPCGHRLADVDVQQGTVEIKCPKCGRLVTYVTAPATNSAAQIRFIDRIVTKA